jgi:two-component system chemotaxis response regulator CheB
VALPSVIKAQKSAAIQPDGPASPLRVLLVDDSIVTRSILENRFVAGSGFCVAASVASAAAGLAALADQPVDIILLDLEMPGIHGVDALPLLRDIAPAARIIIFSAHADLAGALTQRLLALGADDVVAKPARGGFDNQFLTGFLARLRGGGTGEAPEPIHRAVSLHQNDGASTQSLRTGASAAIAAIAIGASTGGVLAIASVLENLPLDLAAPVLIAQHLPHGFLAHFAGQLQRCSGHRVFVAADGMAIEPGGVYLLPGDQHLGLSPQAQSQVQAQAQAQAKPGQGPHLFVGDGAPTAGEFCPSVDRLFTLVATLYGASACGIILSGMGKDGLAGAHHISRAGGLLLAQDSASSTVWGMPGALVNAGLADAVLPPALIGQHVGKCVGGAVGDCARASVGDCAGAAVGNSVGEFSRLQGNRL